jgi:hypothetical protein
MLFVAHQQILSIQICFDPVFQDLVTWVLSYVRKAKYDDIIIYTCPRMYENILVWSGSIVLQYLRHKYNIVVLQYLQPYLQYLRRSIFIYCIAISTVNNIFIAISLAINRGCQKFRQEKKQADE